jgi:hypothetical protein
VYRCDGRRQHGLDHCPQTPLDQAAVDAALVCELTCAYIDLDGTRRRIEQRAAADSALAANALAQAGREATAAAERYQRVQRVQRAFQDGVIEADDWADQRPGLLAEREAADAEVTRIREHADSLAAGGATIDAEAELLRHLADLRAAVVDGIGRAPNIDATRTLLRRLFERVLYLAPGHPWLEMPGFTADMPEAAGGYLLLDLNPGVVEFVDADGNPYFNDVPPDATPEDLGPFDPDEPDPIGVIHKAVLPLEQPLREGLLIE